MTANELWPELPLAAWQDCHATLHLWLQIAGKVRLTLAPPVNHSWNATYYVTTTGLTTSPIPYGDRSFQVDFDFVRHEVVVHASDGPGARVALAPQSVAEFYARVMDALRAIGVDVRIKRKPNEVADPVRFDQDHAHRTYDAEYANRFWRVLVQADRVLKIFRARFIGKASPVHFFWGAPDLAVTRFSGRRAPPHPGGVPNLPDAVTREAYSHEVSSAGFWAGGGPVHYPAFYSYAYPEPAGFAQSRVAPEAAYYHPELREFVLAYDVVRTAASPDDTLLSFLQSTYEAAADLGRWDRDALERAPQSPLPQR